MQTISEHELVDGEQQSTWINQPLPEAGLKVNQVNILSEVGLPQHLFLYLDTSP